MKKKFWVILLSVVGILVLFLVTTPVAAADCPSPPSCPCTCNYEGLTPGFWKNHTNVWPSPYSPNQTLESVFDVPNSFGLDNFTLLQALSFGGGPGNTGMAKNLLRQAVAALLNAADPLINYPVSAANVILWTNGALAADRATMEIQKNWWDQFNNLGSTDY